MDKVKLESKMRDVFGRKTNKGRREGLVPAVVYGRGIKSESLWINRLDLERLLKKSGESTVIDLLIDGKNGRNVIIYEIQRDPVTDKYSHVDFFQVRMDEEIETEVELNFVGEAPAVKELGGVLVKNISEISVKCFPGDLPSEINVDISALKTFEDHICIKDLKISPKVKIDLEPETVVALVEEPRSEAELAGLSEKVEADVTKVEGVTKEETPVGGEMKKKEDNKK
ncbi:MAG: 50S ribosomal protein L25 [Candidatus Pacebacteria bacterium]|nr:50S ribosomal protein L25 [Candidatus Paceibacterota bacterium]MDR3583305.1 50S ribosomal protein L25 [Candidatus Paceibacterota bacterium]